MRIKIPSPPKLEGQESLCSYLYRLAEILNISLDSLPGSSGGGSSLSLSPREIFNSIRRLIAGSTEIFDSFRQKLEPLIKDEYLSIESFNEHALQSQQAMESLETGIDNIRQEIPSIYKDGSWLCRKRGDYVELWGSLDPQQSQYALPVSLENGVVIPAGEVTGSTLTVPENSTNIYITGKEIK